MEDVVMQDKMMPLTINDFSLLKVLGKGSYGKVMLVKKKDTGEIFAIKMLRKEHLIKRNQVIHTKTERFVLENVVHPFIVRMRYAFQNPEKLYFVLEYCPGGELFFHLQRAGRFDEDRARFYTTQLILALEHLHKNNIVYRDLKPENVLIDEDGFAKITDFGLSKENITDNHQTNSFCGTPEYLAPEILARKGHGKAVDWWSLGAIIYEMLTGLPPFYTKDREKLFYNIKYSDLKFPSFISPCCKDLLEKLFVKDPDLRLGGGERDALEIMEHPWFSKVDWIGTLEKTAKPIFKPKLQGDTDTKHFDDDFTKMNPVDSAQNKENPLAAAETGGVTWDGFTYDEESVLDKS